MTREDILKPVKVTTMDDGTGYVFVSYSSRDAERVFKEKIIPLQDRGLRVYCDKQFDASSDNWIDNMKKNMKFCSVVILFISEEYLASYATLLELLNALKEEKEIITVYFGDRREMFGKLSENRAYVSDDVFRTMNKHTKNEYERFSRMVYKGKYADALRDALSEKSIDIKNDKLKKSDIVEIFCEILGRFPVKKFEMSLETLEDVIRDAASKSRYAAVFEEAAASRGGAVFKETGRETSAPGKGKEGAGNAASPAPGLEVPGRIYTFRNAKMRYENQSFVILKGSQIKAEPTKFRSKNAGLMRIYEEAIRDGKLVESERPGFLDVVEDLEGFQSASGAAKMVSGGSESGNVVWKNGKKTFGELYGKDGA